MSLANTLAVCHAAGSLVLLGDPRQLDQPIQGVHPPGTDVSALGHLLGESATVDPSPRRLPRPDVAHAPGHLRVPGPGPLAGHGLRFIPVEHAGNTNASAEESECVAALIGELLDAGAAWGDREGIRKPLTLQDVLVVAPLQRPRRGATVDAAGRRPGGYGRQVPGTGGADRDLLDGHLDR